MLIYLYLKLVKCTYDNLHVLVRRDHVFNNLMGSRVIVVGLNVGDTDLVAVQL